ncbi:MAG TPA: cation:dicarboxylase symporter family transporter, partial [Bryobacteraceae bacterium]|nr:cation:dicarboxylase symporter family transporter [Bryobacteraceae bacterium]
MSLSMKILIGLCGGILCGLFFGEYARGVGVIGDVFVGLLQMTVLPYIVASLIANIGRLSLEQSRKLLLVGGSLLAFFLALGCVTLLVIPLSFPELPSAAFFSRSTIDTREPLDLVGLFVPTNPFQSLASGTIPAIVLFSIAVGIGLIPLKNKTEVIRMLDTVTDALVQVNKVAINFTPVGVFGITASAAGTMTFEEIGRLEAYLLSYTVAAVVLTFFILPGIVAALTPFKFRDVFRVSKDTLLLIFVTGKIILVMPQMIENVKELFRTRTTLDADGKFPEADIIVPLIYPFPNLGTFVIFMFIPFTAWFVGNPMDASNYPVFLGATLLVSFVAPVIGIPFLLDLLKLPNDMFHLFVVSSVYTDRVRVVLGGMHVFVFAVLAVAAFHGLLRIYWNRAVGYAVGSLALAAISAFGVHAFLGKTLEGSYTKDRVIVGMQLLERPAESGVLAAAGPNPEPLKPGENLVDRVRRRGVLRFGYDLQRIPFCFPNSR